MPNIHTLDPERRSSKEKELTARMVELVKDYTDEIPLISLLGIVELVKHETIAHQKAIVTQK